MTEPTKISLKCN